MTQWNEYPTFEELSIGMTIRIKPHLKDKPSTEYESLHWCRATRNEAGKVGVIEDICYEDFTICVVTDTPESQLWYIVDWLDLAVTN